MVSPRPSYQSYHASTLQEQGDQQNDDDLPMPLIVSHRSGRSYFGMACIMFGVLGLVSLYSSWRPDDATTISPIENKSSNNNMLSSASSAAVVGSGGPAGSLRTPTSSMQGSNAGDDKTSQKVEGKTVAQPVERCDWVVKTFVDKYFWVEEEERKKQYAISTQNSNVFYRATANIFWVDFVLNGWGDRIHMNNILSNAVQYDGTPLQPKSLWTWVTGDQHLSNFGAWKNRHGDVVLGVNDFDEAAIYDFGVDVLRIAVSVCSHALTNGLTDEEVKEVLRAFTDTYVETVISYVGSDRELTWELTPETSWGRMREFLMDVRDDRSSGRQLEKFTMVDQHGNRRFITNGSTRLVRVSPEVEKKIRKEFTADRYGATMMKMGWHVKGWSDEYFEVLDIAARVGSGVGSFGVDRFYVLLKGTDKLLEDWVDGDEVILDVKYEPPGAVAQVLSPEDEAWYQVMFENDAQRAVEAQRRLTSYTDPFTGWIVIDDKPFVVRQRSPWKKSPDLSTLTEVDSFSDDMDQVAVSTATSHVRGTVSKSPGQFKHVLASVLGHYRDRTAWGRAVHHVAMDYRQQVLLDFQCFKDYVNELYPDLHGQKFSDDDSGE